MLVQIRSSEADERLPARDDNDVMQAAAWCFQSARRLRTALLGALLLRRYASSSRLILGNHTRMKSPKKAHYQPTRLTYHCLVFGVPSIKFLGIPLFQSQKQPQMKFQWESDAVIVFRSARRTRSATGGLSSSSCRCSCSCSTPSCK